MNGSDATRMQELVDEAAALLVRLCSQPSVAAQHHGTAEMAKLDFRLVPNQDPTDILDKLKAHLRRRATAISPSRPGLTANRLSHRWKTVLPNLPRYGHARPGVGFLLHGHQFHARLSLRASADGSHRAFRLSEELPASCSRLMAAFRSRSRIRPHCSQ